MKAAAAACLVLGLLLSACSGAADPGAGASSSSATVASPSPTPVPEESGTPAARAPQPPAAKNDRRGQIAFAKYVLQAWIYALNTNDPAALLDVSGARPCGGCPELVKELEKRERQGWYVRLEGVRATVGQVKPARGSSKVVLSVAIPESDTYNADGSFRSTNPAHPRSRFEVTMTHTRNRFRLVSFSLY